MKRILIGLAVAIVTTSAFAATKFVSKDEFAASIVGKSVSSTDKKGLPFTAIFKKDGTGDFLKKGKKPANFKWSYSGQTVCWDFGDFKECNKVELISPNSANFYDAKNGNLNNSYSIK